MTPRTRTRQSSQITVRALSNPRDGWTLEGAVRLVNDGYSLEHVERVTGWAAPQVRAHLPRPPRQRLDLDDERVFRP